MQAWGETRALIKADIAPGGPKAKLLGILQAARRYSPERGSFCLHARTDANGKVYHDWRNKGFLCSIQQRVADLHPRDHTPVGEVF